MTADTETYGFPAGYFIIRSIACNRVLDVTQDDIEDGTEIVLWPEKETSLVESFRSPESNNQVFFIDTSGALCSRSAGHAIDIEGDRLVLRHRRPVSYPYPNAYAHPLPRFSYNGQAGEIEVTFITDPTYPSPTSAPSLSSHTWKYKTYLLASMPLRQPKSMFDNATEFISSAITSPFNYLSGKSPVPQANPDAVFDGEIDLSDGDIVDEERGEESEIDDSLEAGRVVRMLSILDKDDHDRMLNEKARNRRKWQVMPLRTTNARTGAI